jgi:putative peptidoglycan lipid II flippase
VATLPVVSRLAADRDLPGIKEAFRSSLALAILLAIPAAAGLIALAEPIVAVIFQHGRFTAWDTQQTAAALTLYSLGLFAFAGVRILVPVYYALDDTKIPVIGSFLTVAANLLVINLTIASLAHRAIALSTSLSMLVNLLFLAVVLYRKVEGYPVGNLLKTLAKVTAASAVMAVVAWKVHSLVLAWLGRSLFGEIVALSGSIFLGVGLYLVLIFSLKIPEFQNILMDLRSRWSRRRAG